MRSPPRHADRSRSSFRPPRTWAHRPVVAVSVAPPADDEAIARASASIDRIASNRARSLACRAESANRLGVAFRHSLCEVRRLVEVRLRAERFIRAVGQVEKIVERGPAAQHGRITAGPPQVDIPWGNRLQASGQAESRRHGRSASSPRSARRETIPERPGRQPIGGRIRLSRLPPSGLSHNRLVSAGIGNLPASKLMGSAYRNPNRLAIWGTRVCRPNRRRANVSTFRSSR